MRIEDIRLKTRKGIYEPREDSYMLARAVDRYAFGRVLDLGTGSGLQGIVAGLNDCKVTFSDIDQNALECAKENAGLNNVHGEFVLSDMFAGISGKFNTIIFNPPYVASDEQRYVALDGGVNGRRYIDRFIATYKGHVLERHHVLLVESSFNRYEEDVRRLNARIVAKEHYFFEDLVVLLF